MGDESDAARLYDLTAARTSRVVLAAYSTSFGLGARLLDAPTRDGIDAVYGLVRIADEVVDTRRGDGAADLLDELEAETARALDRGWSTNLVVHSFARRARCGFGHDEVDPFFASMRTDLTVRVHDRESYERYVYGSAEVVGLMCLAVFLNARRRPGEPLRVPDPVLVGAPARSARRSRRSTSCATCAPTTTSSGARTCPASSPAACAAGTSRRSAAEVEGDLAAARAALPGLPVRPRIAVAATVAVYERLLARLAATPPEDILRARVRIPDTMKVALARARAAGGQLLGQVASARSPRPRKVLA